MSNKKLKTGVRSNNECQNCCLQNMLNWERI